MNRIGVLGSGIVAQTLAAGFRKKGYDVQIGTRTPEKLKDFGTKTGIPAVTFSEAAKFCDIAVLCVKGSAAVESLGTIGIEHLQGKIVIDTTNPIADAPPQNGVLQFFTGPNDSLLERLQAAAPKVRFVKAWNSIGNAFMVDPHFAGGPPTMFICGNDDEARNQVAAMLSAFGFAPEDLGKAEAARAIEPLCQLWCIPGLLRNQWTHAFRLLKL